MTEVDEDAWEFYAKNYDLIGQWVLTGTKRVVLGNQERPWCRFCERGTPEATFATEAHAIPELMGNRSVFTAEECDDCNHFFGQGMENQLGNWSKPVRTFARIRGKAGIPSLKKGSSGGWRIEPGASGFEIKDYEDDPVHRVDEAAKTITFELKRDTFVPVEVLKAFVKIGITLLPSEELPNFRTAIGWLLQSESQPTLILREFPVLYTFRPGPMPDQIVALIIRRRPSVADVPYAFLVLSYGNEVFQVSLPSLERDAHLAGKPISLRYFPFSMPEVEPDIAARRGSARYARLDLTGRKPVKGQVVNMTMSFSDMNVAG